MFLNNNNYARELLYSSVYFIPWFANLQLSISYTTVLVFSFSPIEFDVSRTYVQAACSQEVITLR